MEHYAVLSDIHGNLEALTAVLADIGERGIRTIYCLGDLVGYGPDPAAVIDLATAFSACVLGNHDEAVWNEPLQFTFNPAARRAIEWTRDQLSPSLRTFYRGGHRLDCLRTLPRTHREGDILFCHGTPQSNCIYTVDAVAARAVFAMPEMRGVRLCFCGHTHHPALFTRRGEAVEFLRMRGEVSFTLTPDIDQVIVNDGSVGQPRDGNWRACYVEVDGPVLHFRRVAYEVGTTMDKIMRLPELDDKLAWRLMP